MITDTSYSVYIRRTRAQALAAFNAKTATSVLRRPVDESTYLVQKTGCCASPNVPSAPIVILPNYDISCSDTNGTQVLPSLPTTAFTLTPTSAGAGVALVQYVNASSNVIGSTVIDTTIGSVQLAAPPAGTAAVQYTFPCTPTSIDISCNSSAATNSWQPYQFQNTASASVYISFIPGSVASQWIDPSGLSTTVTGITFYSVDCSGTYFYFGPGADLSVTPAVTPGTTIYVVNETGAQISITFDTPPDPVVPAPIPIPNNESYTGVVELETTSFSITTP